MLSCAPTTLLLCFCRPFIEAASGQDDGARSVCPLRACRVLLDAVSRGEGIDEAPHGPRRATVGGRVRMRGGDCVEQFALYKMDSWPAVGTV